MLEKMGPKKYAFPVLIVVLIGCVMALMFYPMINMSPKELPFAVVSLDEGATTPQGEVNAGKLMVDKLVNAPTPEGSDAAPIKWEQFDSQAAIDEAFANNKLFGALTIPADFTQGQMLAKTGKSEAPSVAVVLDNAKSPMAVMQMQAALGAMFGQMDIPANIQLINTGDADSSATSPMAGMMSQQIGVMPIMIMSMIGSIILTRILPKTNASTTNGRFKALGIQLGYAVGFSFLAAVTSVTLLNTLVGAGAPFWTTTIFLWVASFSVMALFLGAFNIALPLGGLVAFFAFLCGMMLAALPREMLPTFWADWIYPWSPQSHMADGVRDILYRGADLFPLGTGGLLVLGGIGLVLLVIAGFIPGLKPKDANITNAAAGESTTVAV